MTRRRSRMLIPAILLGLCWMISSGPAPAQSMDDTSTKPVRPSDCRHPHILDLTPNHPSVALSAVLTRENGDVCYGVRAKKGQILDVRIIGMGSMNQVGLGVFKPGYSFDSSGPIEFVTGPHLPGLGGTNLAQKAHAVIDRNGLWLLDFGLGNGGASSFTFRASLH